jgi:hypothetical protein
MKNMKRCLILAVICGIFPAIRAFSDENTARRIAVLNKAREYWVDNATFYANYTFKRKAFRSEEEASDKVIEKILANGIIAKDSDKYRNQLHYEGEPARVSENVYTDRSEDVIANRNYMIRYFPSQGSRHIAHGWLREVWTADFSETIGGVNSTITPFSLFLDPIEFLPGDAGYDPENASIATDGHREVITVSGVTSRGTKYVRDVVVQTDEKVPVIEEITLKGYDQENKQLSITVTKGYDWKDCNGIKIPSRVRIFSGPLKPVNMDVDTWVAEEWESYDLGERNPIDLDFTLKFETEDCLIGMNRYPEGGLLNIDEITEADFAKPGLP